MSSIDVIVPCYRYGHYLEQCVASVLSQSVDRIRILVIDDASPDDSAKVGAALAAASPAVTFRRHAVNAGHIATYNEGLEWASADYLLLLSADDYLLPGALARATRLMDRHPEVAFVYGEALELNTWSDDATIACIRGDDEPELCTGRHFIEAMGARNFVQTPTAVVRTRVQKVVGGYRPQLPHAGDMEMWLRLASHGSVGKIRAQQAVYRKHATNMSRSYYEDDCLVDLEQRLAALESFFQSDGWRLRDARHLRRRALHLLGREAIGFASMAFNADRMQDSHRLSAFARRLSPRCILTLPWARLSLKRSIGKRGWASLQAGRARLSQR